MIATSIVQEIRRLLVEEQWSQRKVSRITGISRGTVGRIANGQRPDYLENRRNREEEWPEISGPPERCPTCGGRVYMPCRLCSVRNRMIGKSHKTCNAELETSLTVELPPDLQARYELIHRHAKAGPSRTGDPCKDTFPRLFCEDSV